MAKSKKEIRELVTRVRRMINSPWKRNTLLQDKAYWNMMCSSLDAIEDTEVALESYCQLENIRDDGIQYILIYGVLQALIVQQDATKNLAESLGLKWETKDVLKEIRDIRNDAAGHPTKRSRKKEDAYNFISRGTMSKSGFQIMTSYRDSRPDEFKQCDLFKLIEGQRTALTTVLSDVLSNLYSEQKEHMNEFRGRRIQDLIPSTLDYPLSKIKEASAARKTITDTNTEGRTINIPTSH